MKDVKGCLDGLNVKFSVREDWNDNSVNAWHNSRHFKVRIARNGKSFTTWFYQGRGVQGIPTIEGVIECLLQDRGYALNGLEEFGEEFGWNKDTYKIFKLIKSNSAKLERVLGLDAITELDMVLFGS